MFYLLVLAEATVTDHLIKVLSEITKDGDIHRPQTYAQLVGKIFLIKKLLNFVYIFLSFS